MRNSPRRYGTTLTRGGAHQSLIRITTTFLSVTATTKHARDVAGSRCGAHTADALYDDVGLVGVMLRRAS